MEGKVLSRRPTFIESALALIVCAIIVGVGVFKYHVDPHIPIVICTIFVSCFGMFILRVPWKKLEEGLVTCVSCSVSAFVILMMVGLVIGSWIVSGAVPSIIYYGLNIISPKIFLLAALIISSVVGVATGTSWGTIGTIGIALMGIGEGLGIPAPMTAGAAISGAYFGDKMSPLSDTTNLAPALAGTDLFTHIRAMCWTTGPSMVIVAVIYYFLGLKYGGGAFDPAKIKAIQGLMAAEFNISIIGFIPPILVIGLSIAKVPALPGVFAGIVSASILALVHGTDLGDLLRILHNGYETKVAGAIAGTESLTKVAEILAANNVVGVSAEMAKEASGVLTELLNRGGLDQMMWSVSLIVIAISFGGIMETIGFLEVLLGVMLKDVKSIGGTILATGIACIMSNVFLGEQYLSIVMPGRMFASVYKERGFDPRMLSRSLEDMGTLTSPLVPWNTCGGYLSSMLGVSTLAYAPYALLCYINPIVSVSLAFLGIGNFYIDKNVDEPEEPAVAEA